MNSNNNSIRHILALESGSWKKTFFLDKNSYSIGRSYRNSLIIPHRVISRNHASLIKVDYTNMEDQNDCHSIFWIVDGDLKGNKSTNGIYVNGKQCFCHQLQPGDLIFLGGVEVKAKYDIVDLESKTFLSLSSPNKISLVTYENQDNNDSSFVLPTLNSEGLQNFELISQGVFVIDLETRQILAANSFYCNLVNYSPSEIINLTLNELCTLEADLINHDLEIIKSYNISGNRESIHKTKDQNLVAVFVDYTPVHFQDKRCLLVSVQNIDELKKIEEIIHYQSTHDPITNLPNKKLFIEQLFLSLSNNKIKQECLGIIRLRFNNWENIIYNLNLNHENKLINSLVKLIKNNLSAGDAMTKLSNEEYVIMVEEVKSNNRVTTIIENILSTLHKPLIIDEKSFFISVNFGVSIHPQDGGKITDLLNKASIALESSYTKSVNSYRYYDNEISNRLIERKKDLYNLVFTAINEEKLISKYIPIVNLKTNKISGVHSQLFFEDNEEQNISELDILTTALEIGYIKNLMDWWLNKISEDMILWSENDITINKVTLKILASYLTNSDIIDSLIYLINQNDLFNLELEIIFNNPAIDLKILAENLATLTSLPLNLGLFNFDVSYLKGIDNNQIKFTNLKISESLSENSENNPYQVSLISSAINLGKVLNLNITAEGINTKKAKDLLFDLGCEEMQGLLFSPPLLAENLTDFWQTYSL